MPGLRIHKYGTSAEYVPRRVCLSEFCAELIFNGILIATIATIKKTFDEFSKKGLEEIPDSSMFRPPFDALPVATSERRSKERGGKSRCSFESLSKKFLKIF